MGLKRERLCLLKAKLIGMRDGAAAQSLLDSAQNDRVN